MSISMQEYYDKTIEHLRNQESQAGFIDEDGLFTCQYQDDNGNRCAVGIHIPESRIDELGSLTMNVSTMSKEHPELAGVAWPEGEGLTMAYHLQGLHDRHLYRIEGDRLQHGGLNPDGERKARWIADEYGLIYTYPAPVL